MKQDLLEAAARVLAREGANRFTTNHVAEAAGASVGSVYQYFPNKAALLVALHERDAEATWQKLAPILDDKRRSPRTRFEALIQAFFAIQADASEQHRALGDAQASVAATPAFVAFEARVVAAIETFLRACGCVPANECVFLASFAFTVATSVGERMVARERSKAEASRIGRTTARMLADTLGL